MVAENGHQNSIAQPFFLRMPVNVEVGSVPTEGTVLEHIPPVTIFFPERHVVGNDVQHLSEPNLSEPCAEALVGGGAPNLVVYTLRVDNVITVSASWRGL